MFIDNDVTGELNSKADIEKAIKENIPKQEKEPKNTLKPTVKELLSNAEINIHQKITTPPSVLCIDDISFGTLGNFSCLTGKSKSRKTFFLSILIASAIDSSGKFQRIKSEILGSTVLHFDTEQSEYHTQLVAKRVVSLLDEEKELSNYKCFCLRPHEPKTRIDIIKEAIYNIDNVKLVVIDGIADLIIGYNNEDEAIKVIGEFMKWTFELNIHIITIVHQNKGDNNAKGHLGSLILQKAETVLSIERDGAVSNVESTHSRGIEIQPMSFSIDDSGLPYFVDYTPNTNQNKSEKTNPFNIDLEIHKTILKDTFKDVLELNRNDFLENIKYVLGSYSHSNGDNKCKEFLKYYKERKLVTQPEKFKPYILNI